MERDKPLQYAVSMQPTFAWLEARHRVAIVAHLCRLDPRERVRRFGRALADADIAAFVEDLDFHNHWLHQAAATTVVAIGSCFELPEDDVRGELGADRGAQAYEVCTGIRIEAERLPAGRAYRDTLAQLTA